MRVWMPLPDRDFDVTEVAVPWKLLTDAGVKVVIATETGAIPEADPLLITGVLCGQLGAAPEPLAFYREFEQSPARLAPARWADAEPAEFDGMWLAGGHAPGMRQYLGSDALAAKIATMWAAEKPVAAICHGVLLLARAKDAAGKPLLHGRKTTCLPRYMERTAYFITAWKLGRYYRTYPAYVEEEVRAALASPDDFQRGPRTLSRRGTADDDSPAFFVDDGRYLSARWPGDAYLLSRRFLELLHK